MRYDLGRWDTKSLFSVVQENPIAPRVGQKTVCGLTYTITHLRNLYFTVVVEANTSYNYEVVDVIGNVILSASVVYACQTFKLAYWSYTKHCPVGLTFNLKKPIKKFNYMVYK